MTNKKVQSKIADLLLENLSDAAQERLVKRSRFSKQSKEEVANRIAGNLLRSLVTEKPEGFVDYY